MTDLFSTLAPWSQSLSAKVGDLIRSGSAGLQSALQANEAPALPRLQGKALAEHHLRLALDALHEQGMGKPDRFRKLRLLVNSLEQGHQLSAPPEIQSDSQVSAKTPITPIRRRDRLVALTLATPLWKNLRRESREENVS